ncbi:hypothetical protein G5V59_12820 [Nocardioides sp. W3-2-3]|uniref:hypothetical protein n=1 Tax=Nocardioides convexus TaxID=2712224 RepID=UPI0024188898|nr:hypothetical protein [Nocardioides convexus]NHA00599.1 hypothetical protein [Nocardioides convexus]
MSGDMLESISPTDWGAICEVEEGFTWEEFGVNSQDDFFAHIEKVVKINWGKHAVGARAVQIRIGAACDYAQKSSGPVPYLFAAMLPSRTDKDDAYSLTPRSTGWISPELIIDGSPVQLCADPRFVRVRGAAQTSSFKVLGRIREQLLMELVSSVSQHGSRPGIVQFRAK